jgi:hypothetical protein
MNWSIGWMWRILKCVKFKHGMRIEDEWEAKSHIHKHEHQEVEKQRWVKSEKLKKYIWKK